MKPWLKDNDTDLYLTLNEEKYVVTERFIRASKNKICKFVTSVSKKIQIDKLADIVNKHNNVCHIIAQQKWNLLM